MEIANGIRDDDERWGSEYGSEREKKEKEGEGGGRRGEERRMKKIESKERVGRRKN